MANKDNAISVFNPRYGQAGAELQHLLTTEHYLPFHAPLFSIEPGFDYPVISQQDYQDCGLIFTSRNAVELFLKGHNQLESFAEFTGQQIFAIGKATEKKLLELGAKKVITPEQADSEHFCQLTELAQWQQYAVVKGEQGRDVIATQLAAMEKRVMELNVYQRQWIELDNAELDNVNQQAVWLISSGEMLQHLVACFKKANIEINNQIKILVPSERIKTIASELGLADVINTNSALNSDVVHVLNELKIS